MTASPGAASLQGVFEALRLDATVTGETDGPSITRYEVSLAPELRVGRVLRLEDHLTFHFGAKVRVAPVPGHRLVGVEVVKDSPGTVTLREVWDDEPTVITMGRSLAGPVAERLERLPHMIVAGSTGSGKSVWINSVITELLIKNTPDDLRLVLIDPKRVELSAYAGLPHLEGEVVSTPSAAVAALTHVVAEVDRRYEMMRQADVRHARDLGLPVMVVVIDELADLMITSGKRVESNIVRIAQLARAASVHLIVATQRPSADVITGLIKSNLPARLAFRTSSAIDSRVILDSKGAEALLGRGDGLFRAAGGDLVRVQAPYVSDEQITRIVDYWRTSSAPI